MANNSFEALKAEYADLLFAAQGFGDGVLCRPSQPEPSTDRAFIYPILHGPLLHRLGLAKRA